MGKAQFTIVKSCKVNRTITQAAADVNATAVNNATEQDDPNQQQQTESQMAKTAASDKITNVSPANSVGK